MEEHDDVMIEKHFPLYWLVVRVIRQSLVDYLTKGAEQVVELWVI